MKNLKKSIPTISILALLLIGFSSCNRGYGCPMDFSVVENLAQTTGGILKAIVSFF